jgi:hypothetical protein
VRAGLATYTYPARSNRTFGWAGFTPATGIFTLRTSPTEVVCQLSFITGSGADRELLIATIGGAAFSWVDQCDVTKYPMNVSMLAPFSFDAVQPVCQTPPGAPAASKLAYATTIIWRYRPVALPSPSPSPSASASPSNEPLIRPLSTSGAGSASLSAAIALAVAAGIARALAPVR